MESDHAAAAEHASDHDTAARIKGVPNAIVAKLFGPPPDGLGLTKLEFFSPRNGFRYFPPEPTPRAVTDASGNWNTLVWRPKAVNGFDPDPSYVIYCGDLPDPPNNSG